MNIFNYKKFLSFFCLYFVLLPNSIFAEKLLNKSEILRKSNECSRYLNYKVCYNLLLEMEKIQPDDPDISHNPRTSTMYELRT